MLAYISNEGDMLKHPALQLCYTPGFNFKLDLEQQHVTKTVND